MEVTLDEIVKLATKYAFGMAKEILETNPKYITRRNAQKKYKTLLWRWEQAGLVRAIRTEGCKHDVFPEHRLVELYEDYVFGCEQTMKVKPSKK